MRLSIDAILLYFYVRALNKIVDGKCFVAHPEDQIEFFQPIPLYLSSMEIP